jgi:hypothetical protein
MEPVCYSCMLQFKLCLKNGPLVALTCRCLSGKCRVQHHYVGSKSDDFRAPAVALSGASYYNPPP